MDRERVRQALKYAGLTEYQADAYLTLLDLGTAPAVEIARKCSVPSSQIYTVLRELEDREYIETMDQEKLYAQPEPPETVFEDLTARGELLADAAEEIEERYREPDTVDYRISVTKHPKSAVEQALAGVKDADTVVEIAATPSQLRKLFPELRDARDRGVIVRTTLYLEDHSDVPIDDRMLDGAVSELRLCSIPGPFLVILDRHRVCFAPNSRSDETYGVLIHDRILPFIFHWYFLTCLWNLYPTVYRDDPTTIAYVSLKEFLRDFYSVVQADGFDLIIQVSGSEIRTNSEITITGRVESMTYPQQRLHDPQPSLTELATYATMVLDTGDEMVSVGGWAAVYEDINARRVDVLNIEYTG
ncbi:TrmB family transcriptional regulator [Natranaeroarchaeum sulfidigenes]|uniref:Sugar-specific transcriptional regulator TrmB n=1 Tax=Natranaeroarchaeum sulfidigenes TaxID=2784880 RepID=A0A897MWA8_9EURY|nr:TrmB family transcriptional regulator [Natranaeroarchaeum sulfidigenes]QSG03383.1 Sugar-specific transcriptional regulator TrmB [Natranaeroarchaeum sulfidigenes]